VGSSQMFFSDVHFLHSVKWFFLNPMIALLILDEFKKPRFWGFRRNLPN
jgi:hypothetical protein